MDPAAVLVRFPPSGVPSIVRPGNRCPPFAPRTHRWALKGMQAHIETFDPGVGARGSALSRLESWLAERTSDHGDAWAAREYIWYIGPISTVIQNEN
jgi:hypothetical protein